MVWTYQSCSDTEWLCLDTSALSQQLRRCYDIVNLIGYPGIRRRQAFPSGREVLPWTLPPG